MSCPCCEETEGLKDELKWTYEEIERLTIEPHNHGSPCLSCGLKEMTRDRVCVGCGRQRG